MQYSYRIDKARGLFVTVGIALPNEDEDEDSTDEEGEEDDDERESQEVQNVNRNFRSPQAERATTIVISCKRLRTKSSGLASAIRKH